MFQKVLVPLDGSEDSWKSLDQAIEIAKEENSTIKGLFVTDSRLIEAPFLAAIPADDPIPSSDPTLVKLTLEMSRRINERGDQILAHLIERCQQAGVPAQAERAEGVTSQVILDHAKLSDLIVMGRRGEGARWSGPLLGSTFEAVVRHAPVPVLAAQDKIFTINRILIAFDGSDRALDALNIAAHLVADEKRSLVLITVDDDNPAAKEAHEKAESLLNEKGVKVESIFVKGHAAAEIVQASQKENSDLIVLGAYGHSRFIETLFGSTVDDVMRSAGCPVLICR
jgi:nucleotide-binding universal stress UspA family protein